MWVKICGLRQPDQAVAIADGGFKIFGFICVPSSPRYVPPAQIQRVLTALTPYHSPSGPGITAIGVFADAPWKTLVDVLQTTDLRGIQLHGQESPQFCEQVKQSFPDHHLIKVLRVKSPEDLAGLSAYGATVDSVLLDAYHPHQLGGTGHTLPWQALEGFNPDRPWWLAGGLTPENLPQALAQLHPQGIDLSSGVENSPADKNLLRVAALKTTLTDLGYSLDSLP